jgi:UDP-glucuronate 4-epimerase
MTDPERFLVTGALGCLGAWVLYLLAHEGVDVVGFDLATDRRRLRLIQDEDELDGVDVIQGDVADPLPLADLVESRGITHIVHCAALQVPFVRADPIIGARVNVQGLVAVLEAARMHRALVQGVAYASSAAVFGPSTRYIAGRVDDDAPPAPETLYGVFKLANEGTAKVYGAEHGINAVGLRPFVVYGAGRDAGMTASPTIAIEAAMDDRPFVIDPAGPMAFDHVLDTAQAFVAAARSRPSAPIVFNVPSVTAGASDVIRAIEDAIPEAHGLISAGPTELALPAIVDGARARRVLGLPEPRSLTDGIAQTVAVLRRARLRGSTA